MIRGQMWMWNRWENRRMEMKETGERGWTGTQSVNFPSFLSFSHLTLFYDFIFSIFSDTWKGIHMILGVLFSISHLHSYRNQKYKRYNHKCHVHIDFTFYRTVPAVTSRFSSSSLLSPDGNSWLLLLPRLFLSLSLLSATFHSVVHWDKKDRKKRLIEKGRGCNGVNVEQQVKGMRWLED